MEAFAALYDALDASTATGDKLSALVSYFEQAAATEPADAAWAVYFLAGGKPRQLVPSTVMRQTASRIAGIDGWLFDECYEAVGDLAETIAHLLPDSRPAAASAATAPLGLAAWVQDRLLPLRGLPPPEQAQRLTVWWQELDASGRYILIKLIGGSLRVGVSRLLVQRALATLTGLDAKLLAQRLVGWTDLRSTPSAARWLALVAPPVAAAAGDSPEAAAGSGQPYPFFLAHALQAGPETLGALSDWLVEWKYDGIRAQIVKHGGQVWIWSRGEDLVTDRFPEVVAWAATLPEGTVLDGELLVWLPGSERPAPFKLLQQRIGRKTVGKKLLLDAPVHFVAYDLLQQTGQDLRGFAQGERRARLLALLEQQTPALGGGATAIATASATATVTTTAIAWRVSPAVQAESWAALAALRAQSRERGVEGFMLKQQQSRYGSGRTKADGTWWKWKVDPLSVDAVLIYAQAGHGRRASVYTDYTFAVWSRPPAGAEEAQAVLEAIARRGPAPPRDSGQLQLLPFAKAYSGLTDEEFKAVDRVIRSTTLEKFGPVRSVKPTLLFEIGFEGIGASPRHKSGVAVRFPRMLRLRTDKPLWQADTLQTLQALIDAG
ncbi:MAG: cisplatin damage response ATP-dependent DNA ligase [Rubrivivax sp.]|nr:cisplatin damage response ATP-dependent DNA ligase [Rubrivivax sp.]